MREDAAEYDVVLLQVFRLFGEGIHESLMRTMGKYLEETDGELATSKMSQEAKDLCENLIGHNNHTERPFAIMKAMKHLYPSMSLKYLSHLRVMAHFAWKMKVVRPPKRKAGIASLQGQLTLPTRGYDKRCPVCVASVRPAWAQLRSWLGGI